jgi:hypothetical protein
MKTYLRFVTGAAVLLLIFCVGLFVGYRVFTPKPTPQPVVNTQMILTALRDRGFLVTQTFVFNEPVTITRSTGSALKDFFLGQTITARGTMEVNLGVELADMKEDDVTVEGNIVTVRIPKASLFNTRLVGPVEVKNEQGILKRLLNNDDGYNEALAELTKASEAMAKQPDLLDRADERAQEDVSRILGYMSEGKSINVILK